VAEKIPHLDLLQFGGRDTTMNEYPLHCPEVVSSPEWEVYMGQVMTTPIPAHLLTDQELLQAVKSQQFAVSRLADTLSACQKNLDRRFSLLNDLSDQQRSLQCIQLLAEYHSRQEDRRLEAYKTASAVQAVQTMCDTVLKYSENHQGEDYTHMAVKSIAQSTARIISGQASSPAPAPPPDLEQRVNQALSQGLRWNSNNTRPTKTSTVLKKLDQWEKGYKLAEAMPENDLVSLLSQPSKTLETAYGKSFLIGLCDRLEAALNLPRESLSLTTRFKRIVEASRPSPENYCADVCKKIYGYKDTEVVKILMERASRVGGVENLTKELLRKTCTVNRLPVFFTWKAEHKTPLERFNSLKKGEYDSFYQPLLLR